MSSTIICNSSNIIDTDNNSIFKYNFSSPINLEDKEISLVSVSMYYSWRNITEFNNKLQYTWVDGNVYMTLFYLSDSMKFQILMLIANMCGEATGIIYKK